MSERICNVKPKEYNGRKFRSTLEAKTAETLEAMGLPYKYENRRITLFDGFRCPYQKDKVQSITYTPDFEVGSIILECKGFETPEWRIKKKMLYKYLMQNEPNTIFYQIKNCGKQLLEALDKHWTYLGLAVQVTSKPTPKKHASTRMFSSIAEALDALELENKPIGSILRSLTGQKEYIYGYKWKLKPLPL